jgi:hypothetical protein
MELLQQEVIGLNLADFDLSLLGFAEEQIAGLLDPEGIDREKSGPKGHKGAEEYGEEDFSEFEHKCPRCNFEFNG